MKVYIENDSNKYLFETARDKVASIEEDRLALLKEAIGYIIGFYEKEAKKLKNRLFGRDFNNERDRSYWDSLDFEDILFELDMIGYNPSFREGKLYEKELRSLSDNEDFVRRFATMAQASKGRIDIFELTPEEHELIFK
jgi:hypothetical protein